MFGELRGLLWWVGPISMRPRSPAFRGQFPPSALLCDFRFPKATGLDIHLWPHGFSFRAAALLMRRLCP